ncbi:hypothetical protein DVR12_25325 [Chitinophaga silvatica]|uniref:DUF6443 domain-containing protein n=2 Tax=Chitinophaga silvatica TaxID=2282649 RepID=A0A3E1Y347_9BACT|nr:hypothetical protein DVR12_25325 [Chitinophaga silvatica]
MAFQVKDTTKLPLGFARSWQPHAPLKDASSITDQSKTPADVTQSTIYFDILDRPVQAVGKNTSPQNQDEVSVFVYDSLGRQNIHYLPYTGSGSGNYKPNWLTEQNQANSSLYPGQAPYYGGITYEESPHGRALKKMMPGQAWKGSNRGVSFDYQLNTVSDSVRIWELSSDTDIPYSPGFYGAGTLTKNIVTDEDNHQVISYTDNTGKLILSKLKAIDAPGTAHMGWLCTYYVYNDLFQLRYSIPPLAVALINSTWNINPALNLCQKLSYDERERVIIKKNPDVAPVEMVYDNKNRLVFYRDGGMLSRSIWVVNFYDDQDRNTITALYHSASSREQLQALMNTASSGNTSASYVVPGKADLIVANFQEGEKSYKATNSISFEPGFESSVGSEFETLIDKNLTNGTETIIVNNPLPNISNYDPIIYTYYDNYNFNGARPFEPGFIPKLNAGNDTHPLPVVPIYYTEGMCTGRKIRISGTDEWLTTTLYYDEKEHLIQSRIDNITGGESINTSQYSYDGKLLSTYQYVSNRQSAGFRETKVMTSNIFDINGNLIAVKKQVNDNPSFSKEIVNYEYDNVGRLSAKKLGKQTNGSFLETLSYNYNIHNWLTGINNEYLNGTASDGKHFGLQLGYESGFDSPRYTGSLSGVSWKGWNDKIARRYNFRYDNASQLSSANFTQQNPGSTNWSNNLANFSVEGLSYDANGNILSMKQYGLKALQPTIIDNLTFKNYDYSNQLRYATDASNDFSSKMGDFKEPVGNGIANTASNIPDYTYDQNGNLASDANKGIASVLYNEQHLPYKITVTGKGTIEYLYDASGKKLRKIVTDITRQPARVINTDYIGNMVFKNDTLQFIAHEEGRVRPVFNKQTPDINYVYDYFVKDNTGNTRMILTEQTNFSMYAATMETASAAKETALFSNIENSRVNTPVGYPEDNTTNENQFVAKLNAQQGGQPIGPSLVLRVMAGDTLHVNVKAFYKSNGPAEKNAPLTDNMLNALAQSFGSTGEFSTDDHGISASANNSPINSNFYNTDYQRLKERNNDPAQISRPSAYLNYVLFDEQFKLVEENSGVKQVQQTPDQLQSLNPEEIVVAKSGYVYVYTSNETPQDVYFDNLIVTVNNVGVLEESHFYPGGLIMDGISYRAYAALDNAVLYQGKELQHNEFEDGSGLDWYDFDARYYDPQTSRWLSPDPLNQFSSPYLAMANNGHQVIDPDGKWAFIDDIAAMAIGGVINVVSQAMAGKVTNLWEGLSYFAVGAAAAEVTIYAGPLAGGAVSGAGNNAVDQLFLNGFSKFDFEKTLVSAGTGAASSFVGAKLSGALGPVIEKIGVKIASPVIKSGLQNSMLGGLTGMTIGTGMGFLQGKSLGDAFWSDGISGAGTGMVAGAISGAAGAYKQARDTEHNPWTGRWEGKLDEIPVKRIYDYATDNGLKSTQQGELDPTKVLNFYQLMKDGKFDPYKGQAGGYKNYGDTYLGDGNHRSAAGILFFLKTGDMGPLNIILNNENFRSIPKAPNNGSSYRTIKAPQK